MQLPLGSEGWNQRNVTLGGWMYGYTLPARNHSRPEFQTNVKKGLYYGQADR